MRLFPEQFHPQEWQGARKKLFVAASDAFQQLLGDALLLQFSALAHITSTAGRDGAIDAWVEKNAQGSGQFSAFQFPLIVECKHHDDELANTAYNIRQGWLKVKEKLEKQANEGWPQLYAPWKQTKSYLYCISARFPNQQARAELQKEIRGFFSVLSEAQQLSIEPEQIRVWDWSDLQAWLNQNTILCDHWLGIELAQWIDHLSLRERLVHAASSNEQAFQAYLLQEYLPFVPPADDNPAHPKILLQSLINDENVLLIGEGGIGKTRTMQEVAELAHSIGWRVLHLLPSEQDVDLGTAAKTLLRPAKDTLVLIDYIDQLAHFDARYWLSSLQPEAKRRNIRLHLLTNARPSGSSESLRHLQDSGLFCSIEMTQSTMHRDRIATAIEDHLCPTAILQIGRECVRRHCGNRPIIAMFISQALERLAQVGKLENQQDDIPRPDDLLGWIRKRLREAELLSVPTPPTLRWKTPPALAPEIISIAAALAVCPFPIDELQDVVRTTLASLGSDGGGEKWIVEMLRNDGWIEAGIDGIFRTPHDSIPDEVLREVLAHPDNVLPGLLSSVHLGRPLGRFARSLGRLSGIAALPSTQKLQIEQAAVLWLIGNAEILGQTLLQKQPDAVAYALGALFDYHPWHQVAQTLWGDLIAPWLSSYGHLPAARHLLHRGLKSLPDNTLLHSALGWLKSNPNVRTGSFILAPLVSWDATRLGDQQQAVLAAATQWLNDPKNITCSDSQFVLAPLLNWDAARLDGKQKDILSTAIRWLESSKNVNSPDASFVLPSALNWDAVRLGDQQRRVCATAINWLEHATKVNAPGADFVLQPPLNWDAARMGDQQKAALATAICWLEHPNNATNTNAHYVLHKLLNWSAKRLGVQQENVLAAAIRWIQDAKNITTPEAGFVLPSLLNWDSTRLGNKQKTVLKAAIQWLEFAINDATLKPEFVLQPLLNWDAARLGDQENAALTSAIRWLENPNNSTSQGVGYILPRLLKWNSLPTTKRRQYALLAIEWTDRSWERDDVTYMLKSLLQAVNQYPDHLDMNPILIRAGKWLDHHANHPERGFVIARLVRMKNISQELWAPLAKAGLDFLEKNRASSSDDFLLNGILARLSTLPAEQNRWTSLAVRWIACANSKAAPISIYDNCRRFLPNRDLEIIRPHLITAHMKRPEFGGYDWFSQKSKARF